SESQSENIETDSEKSGSLAESEPQSESIDIETDSEKSDSATESEPQPGSIKTHSENSDSDDYEGNYANYDYKYIYIIKNLASNRFCLLLCLTLLISTDNYDSDDYDYNDKCIDED